MSKIIFEFGEERYSRKIAKSIKSTKNILTALDLKEAIRRATPPHKRNKTLARVFQAIRIAVNNELEKLPLDNNYKLYISTLLKDCGYKDIGDTFKCSYYKPLISENLIN